jgi:hypothetical protein
MDPQMLTFYRQYMQQFSHLTYPSGELLKLEDVQKTLELYFFNNDNVKNIPLSYQAKVLERIITLIESAVGNPEEEVSAQTFRTII